jgi:hypothetical protein
VITGPFFDFLGRFPAAELPSLFKLYKKGIGFIKKIKCVKG